LAANAVTGTDVREDRVEALRWISKHGQLWSMQR